MKKQQRLISWIRIVGEITSGLWAILGSLTQAMDITSSLNKGWQVFGAITVFIILAFWRMYDNALRIKPNIEIYKVRTILKTVYTKKFGDPSVVNSTQTPSISFRNTSKDLSSTDFEYWNEIQGNEYYFSLVDYINNPGIRSEQSVAKKVIAEIHYFAEDGKSLVDERGIIGRWWDEPEKHDLPRSQAPHVLQEIDISPSGKKVRTLVIAMKHKNEDILFAYNMDSIEHHEWRKKEYLLGKGNKFIQVVLAGENVDDIENWFRIYVNNGTLITETINKPSFK